MGPKGLWSRGVADLRRLCVLQFLPPQIGTRLYELDGGGLPFAKYGKANRAMWFVTALSQKPDVQRYLEQYRAEEDKRIKEKMQSNKKELDSTKDDLAAANARIQELMNQLQSLPVPPKTTTNLAGSATTAAPPAATPPTAKASAKQH